MKILQPMPRTTSIKIMDIIVLHNLANLQFHSVSLLMSELSLAEYVEAEFKFNEKLQKNQKLVILRCSSAPHGINERFSFNAFFVTMLPPITELHIIQYINIHTTHNPPLCSDEGLVNARNVRFEKFATAVNLSTLSLYPLRVDNPTKCFTCPPMQHHMYSFIRN